MLKIGGGNKLAELQNGLSENKLVLSVLLLLEEPFGELAQILVFVLLQRFDEGLLLSVDLLSGRNNGLVLFFELLPDSDSVGQLEFLEGSPIEPTEDDEANECASEQLVVLFILDDLEANVLRVYFLEGVDGKVVAIETEVG